MSFSENLFFAAEPTNQAWSLIALVLARLLVALLAARARTRTEVHISRNLRLKMLGSYISSDAEARVGLARGSDQQAIAFWPQQTGSQLGSLLSSISNVLIMMAMLSIALVAEPIASVVILLSMFVGSVCFWPLRRRIRRLSHGVIQTQGELANSIHELGDLISEAEIFGVKEELGGRVTKLIEEEAVWRTKTTFSKAAVSPLYTALLFLGVAVGALFFVSSESDQLDRYGPVLLIVIRSISYGQSIQQIGSNLASLAPLVRRLRSVDDALRRVSLPWGSRGLPSFESFELVDVSYRYRDSGFSLRNVNLKVTRGMRVGIVGPSGGGKTTIARLILRQAKPTTGSVLINGVAIEEIEESAFRQQISAVPQFPHLLDGSLEQNIRFFRESIDDDSVLSALAGADLSSEGVTSIAPPEGGAGGSSMSGGQMQRVGVARALAGGPEVLVLDEPTSAIDQVSQTRIIEALKAMPDSICIIIITHRQEILDLCSTLVVVEDGRITACGSPEEVLSNSDYFAEERHGPTFMR